MNAIEYVKALDDIHYEALKLVTDLDKQRDWIGDQAIEHLKALYDSSVSLAAAAHIDLQTALTKDALNQ